MLFGIDPFREFDRTPVMPIDAYRRGDELVVDVDLPGVDPASIDVTVDGNVLTVQAKRPRATEEGDRVLTAERPQGTFTRRLRLGRGFDGANVAANYEHGVLTIRVPVAVEAQPRRVEITSGRAA